MALPSVATLEQTSASGPTGADGQGGAYRHIDSLTSCRGIAAMIVLTFHYTGGFLPSLKPYEYTAFISHGYLWVDFFFLLSGFVLAQAHAHRFRTGLEPATVRSFILARFCRIYPLHFAILAGYVALEVVRYILTVQGIGFADFRTFVGSHSLLALLSNLLLLQTTGLHEAMTWNGPAWSIGAEWFAYLAFPLLALGLMQRGPLLASAVILVAFTILAVISEGGRDLDVTYDYGLVRCLCEFVVGMLLHCLIGPARRLHLGHDVACLALIVVLVIALHLGVRDIAIPPLMAALVLGLALNEGRVSRTLSHPALLWLGAVSYPIYMVHMLLLATVNTAAVTILGQSIGRYLNYWESCIMLAAMTGLSLWCASVLHTYMELRVPAAMKHSRLAAQFVR